MTFVVKPIEASTFKDLEGLFATDEQCADCWCMNHRLPAADLMFGEEAREQLQNLVGSRRVHGLLAYQGTQCVGWGAVDPLTAQVGHDYVIETHDQAPDSWAIHCLFVHPDFRGQGVSFLLIDACVSLAQQGGAKKVLAFPIPIDSQGKFPVHEAEFSGRFSTYEKKGFTAQRRLNDFCVVVAKKL